MNVLDKARVILYRYHEKSLEVFLIKPKAGEDPNVWKFPKASKDKKQSTHCIALDPVKIDDQYQLNTIAVEADWHDIPSIRGLVRHDINRVKSKIKSTIPEIEEGTYIALKDAFKKVLPQEYAALKELKDVLVERQSTSNI